jgi:hypothetical protein
MRQTDETSSKKHYRSHVDLLDNAISVWRADRSPSAGREITLPFQFQFPNVNNLPPSFHAKGKMYEASVRYYVKVVGVRSGELRRNIRITVNLPFLPLDPNPLPPQVHLPQWVGEWASYRKSKSMRKGILGGYGKVDTELCLSFVSSLQVQYPHNLTPDSNSCSSLLPSLPTYTYPAPCNDHIKSPPRIILSRYFNFRISAFQTLPCLVIFKPRIRASSFRTRNVP